MINRVSAWSWFGVGTMLYGWRRTEDGHWIITRWITLFFFPLIPVGSYRVNIYTDLRTLRVYLLYMLQIVHDEFELQCKLTLCWRQIGNTCVYVYLPWCVALTTGWWVPDIVSLMMATGILSSWFYAGYKMRRRRP